MSLNIDVNLKLEDDNAPEHVPVVPYDIQREREKEATRKLAEELRKKGSIEPVIVTKEGIAKKAN